MKNRKQGSGSYMSKRIADKFVAWQAECEARFQQLKANEEELNRIFIEISSCNK